MSVDLYRLYDEADTLLYVGISYSATQRIASHRADKPWWGDVRRITVDKHPTRSDALDAERAAIIAEKPLHNVVHNTHAVAFRLKPENAWVRGKRTSLLTAHDINLPRPGNSGCWQCETSIVVAGVVKDHNLIIQVCPMCGGKHTHGWLVKEIYINDRGHIVGISDRMPHCHPKPMVYQTIRFAVTNKQIITRENAERSYSEFMRQRYPQSAPT